jgi:hypothetical protein
MIVPKNYKMVGNELLLNQPRIHVINNRVKSPFTLRMTLNTNTSPKFINNKILRHTIQQSNQIIDMVNKKVQ